MHQRLRLHPTLPGRRGNLVGQAGRRRRLLRRAVLLRRADRDESGQCQRDPDRWRRQRDLLAGLRPLDQRRGPPPYPPPPGRPRGPPPRPPPPPPPPATPHPP